MTFTTIPSVLNGGGSSPGNNECAPPSKCLTLADRFYDLTGVLIHRLNFHGLVEGDCEGRRQIPGSAHASGPARGACGGTSVLIKNPLFQGLPADPAAAAGVTLQSDCGPGCSFTP